MPKEPTKPLPTPTFALYSLHRWRIADRYAVLTRDENGNETVAMYLALRRRPLPFWHRILHRLFWDARHHR